MLSEWYYLLPPAIQQPKKSIHDQAPMKWFGIIILNKEIIRIDPLLLEIDPSWRLGISIRHFSVTEHYQSHEGKI